MGVPAGMKRVRWGAGIALLLAIAYIILAHRLPFNPYRIGGYTAFPDADCVGVAVNLNVSYALEPVTLGTPGMFEGETYFAEVDGLGKTLKQPFDEDLTKLELGSHTVPSKVIRVAPPEAGRWRLITEGYVTGRVLLFPRNTPLYFESDQIFETWPADDPRCLP